MQEETIVRIDTKDLKNTAKDLRVEQKVYLSGYVYTMFDLAHWRLNELIRENKPLPLSLDGITVYYTSPSPTPKGKLIGSCGPTTSARLDQYTPKLMDLGVSCTIGKGERSQEVYEAIQRNQGVYLTSVGGAGALLASCIEECEDIAFLEFGLDCIKRLKIKDFPLIVAADCSGRNIFDIGRFKFRKL